MFDSPAVQGWLGRGWRAAEGCEHPLGTLAGQRLDGVTVMPLLGPENRFGARYFHLFLLDEGGRTSEEAAVSGLHSSGPYPGYNWVEILELGERVNFGCSVGAEPHAVDLKQTGLDLRLLGGLAALIPPGGHMMIEYDSPGQWETARCLSLGIPPAASPLGYLLHSVGCGAGFRDWYFAEGGREGPRKLQGCKPLNVAQARESVCALAGELLSFLRRLLEPRHGAVEAGARQRAKDVLAALTVADTALQEEVRRALASGGEGRCKKT